ncbi:MAG TPA: hypothetical protein VJ608_00655 [Albitalea sp.]|nr:hypothetical protein [Albitalea sp.]
MSAPPPKRVPDADAERWRELVSAVGSEIALPLSAALERIHALTTSGRIDRASLRALREEVESARRSGMIAQQLARFASGRLRQSHERLSLAQTLQAVLAHRARETAARGITIKPALKAADVIVDASLLFTLLNTLLDWTLAHARSQVDLTIELTTWPVYARLLCSFAQPAADVAIAGTAVPAAALDSLTWRLLEQTAATMGLRLARNAQGPRLSVSLEFPRTVGDDAASNAPEPDSGFATTSNSKPLAGSHVLVIASRREMRLRVRDAIRQMGLVIDFVASIAEATDFCRDGLPHAIVVEGVLRGERLNHLRAEIHAELPSFPFIEIVEEGAGYQMSGMHGETMGRVGRDAIETALPSVLMFELSRTL